MDPKITRNFVDQFWNSSVMPSLSQYISIPCKSPAFDANWQQTGFLDQAINLMIKWVKAQNIPGTEIETIRLENYAPCLYIEIPGNTDKTVMFYGHLDKMPEAEGWRDGLGPWMPVVEGHKLYGRGSVDDGYALFSAITAVKSLHEQNIAHDRYVFVFECAEESGSIGFPEYLECLKDRINNPNLIIVLDSGCSDCERLWITDSFRGNLTGKLRVDILPSGMHSGMAGGVVPSTFMIIRQLLDRIENAGNGKILIESANIKIPQERVEQAKFMAQILGDRVHKDFPVLEGGRLLADEPHELLLNCLWRPALSIVGAEGIPAIENAGNALRPFTTLVIGMRLPPHCDTKKVAKDVQQILESEPPYGAKVTYTPTMLLNGWAAPKMSERLENIINDASREHFGEEPVYAGCGASIGIIKILGEVFGDAHFIVSGAEVPDSNAHGANEYLHIPLAKKITSVVAQILAKHSSEN